jgi:2-dehydro-3-deoxygluconokinase
MMTGSPRKVLAIGEAMLEMAPVGEHLYRQGFAGETFNTAWHMAQLLVGYADVGFVTCIGQDKFSDRLAAEMAQDGLDVRGVARDAERQMGLYVIELDGAERTFHYWRKDSAARRLADDLSRLEEQLQGADLIHVSGITLAILADTARDNLISCLGRMRDRGAIVSFDPNVRPRLWNSPDDCKIALSPMLKVTDIALPSFDDEQQMWSDLTPEVTIERFRAAGVNEVVVKDGARPVHLRSVETVLVVDTPSVVEVRDTTGAGDAFNAGYLSARLRGSEPDAAVRTGQMLSAEVIGTYGARAPRADVRRMGSAIAYGSNT